MKSEGKFNLNPEEFRLLRSLSTPNKIQKYLDDLPYNKEHGGETCRSPRRVIRDRTAHCFEGALLAAAALRIQRRQPWIFDLESVRDDDHVIAIYRDGGCWGSIAKSNYSGLRFREPVYRTLRELALSYFEDYFNLKGEKSLRGSIPGPSISGASIKLQWMTAEEDSVADSGLPLAGFHTLHCSRPAGECTPIRVCSKPELSGGWSRNDRGTRLNEFLKDFSVNARTLIPLFRYLLLQTETHAFCVSALACPRR